MSNNPKKSKKEKSKNDKAWEVIFQTYNILDEINKNGIYKISATVINEEREARLMTKFDHKIQLPLVFNLIRGELILLGNLRVIKIFQKENQNLQAFQKFLFQSILKP
jgi:hypothetical protein